MLWRVCAAKDSEGFLKPSIHGRQGTSLRPLLYHDSGATLSEKSSTDPSSSPQDFRPSKDLTVSLPSTLLPSPQLQFQIWALMLNQLLLHGEEGPEAMKLGQLCLVLCAKGTLGEGAPKWNMPSRAGRSVLRMPGSLSCCLLNHIFRLLDPQGM